MNRRWICTDIWMDMFPFFDRPQLGLKLALLSPRFDIFWNAALRWADAKCGQNGIECSAENRRAMLGSALFKIRFPLLSSEEFSEKIVPSDVLSKDEVIAVYRFHSLPNCHGKSGGLFPMQFQTDGRLSDHKSGTLLIDIEKLSEFARENVGSSRYSEKCT